MQRAAAGRIALVVLSVALGLLAVEVLARMVWGNASSSPAAENANLPLLNDLRDLAHPNVHGVNRGVLYRTNSLAFRGPEWAREPAPGVFRIAVAGDSTSMGSGVAEADRYSDQLERLLNASDSSRGYEVINTALSGLNVEQGVTRLERGLRHYRVDLLVFGTSRNDIEGKAYEHLDLENDGGDWWAWAGRHARSPSYFWRLLTFRIAQVQGREGREAKRAEIHHNYFENPRAWRDFVAGFDHLARLARSRDVCAQVFVLAFLNDLGPQDPERVVYERVEQAARRRGFGVTQSFPALEGRSAESLWVSRFDPHPNAEAHTILAEALYDGLRELPEKCWKSAKR